MFIINKTKKNSTETEYLLSNKFIGFHAFTHKVYLGVERFMNVLYYILSITERKPTEKTTQQIILYFVV